ncbi:MAG: hypothetical protein K8I03_01930 [Ignavibacteria bacterium]|nr:hypothetical protein [Ignavibacteria bacterium]
MLYYLKSKSFHHPPVGGHATGAEIIKGKIKCPTLSGSRRTVPPQGRGTKARIKLLNYPAVWAIFFNALDRFLMITRDFLNQSSAKGLRSAHFAAGNLRLFSFATTFFFV